MKVGVRANLEDLLKVDPYPALAWAKENFLPGEEFSPFSFQFGSRKN